MIQYFCSFLDIYSNQRFEYRCQASTGDVLEWKGCDSFSPNRAGVPVPHFSEGVKMSNNNNQIMIAQPDWKQELKYVALECGWQALCGCVEIAKVTLGNFIHYAIFQCGNHLQDEIDHKKNCVRGK